MREVPPSTVTTPHSNTHELNEALGGLGARSVRLLRRGSRGTYRPTMEALLICRLKRPQGEKPKGNVVVAKSGEERQQKPVEVLVLDGDVRQRRLKNAAGRRKALKMRRAVKKASPLTPTGWWKRPHEVGSRFAGSDAADVAFDSVAARLEGTNPMVSATNKPKPTDQATVMEGFQDVELELKPELIQTQMAQRLMLRVEVYARALRASQNVKTAEDWWANTYLK